MTRKLTVIGVLAALVLGVAGLTQSATATPVQTFCSGSALVAHGGCASGLLAVHSVYCFDTGGGVMPSGPIPPSGVLACGAGSSSSTAPLGVAGMPIRTWQILMVPSGARQTLPAYYLPAPWSYRLPAAPVGASTGNVSATADWLCDGGLDILSPTQELSGNVNIWPGHGWTGFNFIRQNVGSAATPGVPDGTTGSFNGYVNATRPMPATFANVTLDRSNLLLLWLGGTTPLTIRPTIADGVGPANQGTPLQRLVTASPYVAGMAVSIALLTGDPAPPNQSFLCLDSPQNSVAENTEIVPPTVAGNYVRWTAAQSAGDIIDGTTTRMLDVQCVTVGGAAGTCDMADADNDLVPAAVEAVNGTSSATGDTDGDGSSDFDEIFQFSNPLVADTDGDGSLDKQDDLAGFNCVSVNGVCSVVNLGDTTADDNCPVDANPGQENTDSQPDFTNSPNTPSGALYRGDATNPHQDHQGDACDTDADGDGLNNLTEAGFQHPTVSPGAAGGPPAGALYCLGLGASVPPGGSTTVTTEPLNPDSDADGGLDGRECLFGSDPKSAGAGSCQPACVGTNRFPALIGDTDGDLLSGTIVGGGNAAEMFYRTQHINLPGGTTLNDLEQPGSYGLVIPDTKVGNLDNDSDGDLINDGVEVKWYATAPANFDTDGDGCSDGREMADVNGDHKVNATDLLAVAQHGSTGSLAPGKVGVPLPLGSPAPAYLVAGVRRAEVATYDVNKDGKIDSTDLLIVAKLSGNCAFGTGAQTAQAIVNAAFP
jgi:hypothetical protein